MQRLIALLIVLSMALAHSVKVSNGWVRLVPGPTAGAFMTLTNPALKEPLVIVGASSPVATKVTLHKTEKMSGMDMTRMRPVASISIPPKGSVQLQPGGLHMMLEGIKTPLKEGQKVKIVLKFDDGDTQTLELTVKNQ